MKQGTSEKKRSENKIAEKKTAGKKKRKKSIKRTRAGRHVAAGILTTAAMLAVVVGLVFILLYKMGETRLTKAAAASMPDAGLLADKKAEQNIREKAGLDALQWQENWVALGDKVYAYEEEAINLLVLGVDKAGELTMETDYEKWSGGQTDAIFVVHLSPQERRVAILGIPRNSMVDVDIYDGEGHIKETVYDQICLQYAYAGGGEPGLAKIKETVSSLLYGLPIHGTVAVSYGAVGQLNDMVGGVDVVALESLKTPYGSYEKGDALHLEGEFVLAYVKARDMEVVGSPTLRLERQKQYLTALVGKVKGEIKENPMLVKELYTTAVPYMNTDVTLDEVVYLAAQAADYRFDGNDIYLLQGEDRMAPVVKDGKETGDYYDDYYLDEGNVRETMIKVFYREVVLEQQGDAG